MLTAGGFRGKARIKMSRIGFIAVAHPDYITDGCAKSFADRAVNEVRKRGIELYYPDRLASTAEEAREDAAGCVRNGCEGIILFLSSWIECPVAMTAVTETAHLPLLIWGFPMWVENGVEKSTGSYVSYTMFRGVLARVGHNFCEAVGMPENEETIKEVVSFCRAAQTRARLKRSKIGLVGYTSMSIYTGTFDHVLLRWIIGPEVEQSDSYSLIRRAERTTPEQRKEAAELLKSRARVLPAVSGKMLDKAMGLYLAIEELKKETGIDAINVKCQYEFSKEYGMTMCVPLSLSASENFVTSCEGDMLCTVSMLILQYLTGQVIAYGDAINHEGDILKMSPCGFMPFQLAGSEPVVDNFLEGVGFTGIQNCFTMKPGKVTLFRLIEDVGTYHMLITTGDGLPSTKLRQGHMPCLDVVPQCDIGKLEKEYSGQHFAICYGDVSDELAKLAGMLGIKSILL